LADLDKSDAPASEAQGDEIVSLGFLNPLQGEIEKDRSFFRISLSLFPVPAHSPLIPFEQEFDVGRFPQSRSFSIHPP